MNASDESPFVRFVWHLISWHLSNVVWNVITAWPRHCMVFISRPFGSSNWVVICIRVPIVAYIVGAGARTRLATGYLWAVTTSESTCMGIPFDWRDVRLVCSGGWLPVVIFVSKFWSHGVSWPKTTCAMGVMTGSWIVFVGHEASRAIELIACIMRSKTASLTRPHIISVMLTWPRSRAIGTDEVTASTFTELWTLMTCPSICVILSGSWSISNWHGISVWCPRFHCDALISDRWLSIVLSGSWVSHQVSCILSSWSAKYVSIFYVHIPWRVVHSRARCSVRNSYPSVSFIGAKTDVRSDVLRSTSCSQIVRAWSDFSTCLRINYQRTSCFYTESSTCRFRSVFDCILTRPGRSCAPTEETFAITAGHSSSMSAKAASKGILTRSWSLVFAFQTISTAFWDPTCQIRVCY